MGKGLIVSLGGGDHSMANSYMAHKFKWEEGPWWDDLEKRDGWINELRQTFEHERDDIVCRFNHRLEELNLQQNDVRNRLESVASSLDEGGGLRKIFESVVNDQMQRLDEKAVKCQEATCRSELAAGRAAESCKDAASLKDQAQNAAREAAARASEVNNRAQAAERFCIEANEAAARAGQAAEKAVASESAVAGNADTVQKMVVTVADVLDAAKKERDALREGCEQAGAAAQQAINAREQALNAAKAAETNASDTAAKIELVDHRCQEAINAADIARTAAESAGVCLQNLHSLAINEQESMETAARNALQKWDERMGEACREADSFRLEMVEMKAVLEKAMQEANEEKRKLIETTMTTVQNAVNAAQGAAREAREAVVGLNKEIVNARQQTMERTAELSQAVETAKSLLNGASFVMRMRWLLIGSLNRNGVVSALPGGSE